MASKDYLKTAYRQLQTDLTTLTREQETEIFNAYKRAGTNLIAKFDAARDGSATKAYYNSYVRSLYREMDSMVSNGAGIALQMPIDFQRRILQTSFQLGGMDASKVPNFNKAFGKIPKETLSKILNGDIYKDGKGLSDRIWGAAIKSGADIQGVVLAGMAQKMSAVEMSKMLQAYVDPAMRKTWNNAKIKSVLGDGYARWNGNLEYNALRLSRTTITHAFQMGTVQAAKANPFITKIKWHSVLAHGRTCDTCRARHGQTFLPDALPLDHPNGLCYQTSIIGDGDQSKALETVGNDLKGWLEGAKMPKVDALMVRNGTPFRNKVTNPIWNQYNRYIGTKRGQNVSPSAFRQQVLDVVASSGGKLTEMEAAEQITGIILKTGKKAAATPALFTIDKTKPFAEQFYEVSNPPSGTLNGNAGIREIRQALIKSNDLDTLKKSEFFVYTGGAEGDVFRQQLAQYRAYLKPFNNIEAEKYLDEIIAGTRNPEGFFCYTSGTVNKIDVFIDPYLKSKGVPDAIIQSIDNILRGMFAKSGMPTTFMAADGTWVTAAKLGVKAVQSVAQATAQTTAAVTPTVGATGKETMRSRMGVNAKLNGHKSGDMWEEDGFIFLNDTNGRRVKMFYFERGDTLFVQPANGIDDARQVLTMDEIQRAFDKLPRQLRESVNEIQLTDWRNPEDIVRQRTWKGRGEYRSAATASKFDKSITFWENDGFYDRSVYSRETIVNHNRKELLNTIAHEAGHGFDHNAGPLVQSPYSGSMGYQRLSMSREYLTAVADDMRSKGRAVNRGFVTKYAMEYWDTANAYTEDFAELVALYVESPHIAQADFPNRVAFLKKYLALYEAD